MALIQMKILKTKGSEVPKKVLFKAKRFGLSPSVHQWHMNDFLKIMRENNGCVRENI